MYAVMLTWTVATIMVAEWWGVALAGRKAMAEAANGRS